MTWLGLWHRDAQYFDPAGLTPEGENSCLLLREANALLARGALVLEVAMPVLHKPEPLILLERGGDWPLRFALSAVPGGGINLVLEQYGTVLHKTVNPTTKGRADRVRLTYSWDAPAFRGQLALEWPEGGRAEIAQIEGPRPWRLEDLQALLSGVPQCYVAPGVDYIALSSTLEPVGPMPGLAPDTPVETEAGLRRIGDLRRGDLLRCASGELVPVLHVATRQVPALGAFHPVRLRAPYFGLTQDIVVAPYQRMVLTGSEVEYLFGCEAVLAPAEMLAGTRTAHRELRQKPLTTYTQVILPGHEVPVAAGLGVESLFLGRLRRDRQALAASLFSDVDRNSLPEHAQPRYPVVRAFDAAILAEHRTA
ncbi:Hint domain-containing protein [Tritonibacter scottomollicae]|uniref:Hint domain-containing protein n=1 Tax=Tritonibacter scottomollicae TaxID=483013 RepID=A0A2T1AL26_TRISK|nr:Hint domain-containing protein [Tritonibacter scottomollicae]PRZ49311.1 Hint domain-containing protein [Tritonibacter scottomollicae]